MIGLYRSGTTARQVAERFGVRLRSVKRLLHQHGVRRKAAHAGYPHLVRAYSNRPDLLERLQEVLEGLGKRGRKPWSPPSRLILSAALVRWPATRERR